MHIKYLDQIYYKSKIQSLYYLIYYLNIIITYIYIKKYKHIKISTANIIDKYSISLKI